MSNYSGFIYKPARRSPLQVRIWGLDANGRPFSQSASAMEVNSHRVVLEEVAAPIKDNDVIGLSFGEKKARFRLLRLSVPGENGGRRAELEMVAPAVDDFWNHDTEATPTENRPAERRKTPRYRCTGFIAFSTEGPAVVRAQISDISKNGCYIDIEMPYPVGTALQVKISLMGATVDAPAVVASSHPGVGMGIHFDEHRLIGKLELEEVLAQLEHNILSKQGI